MPQRTCDVDGCNRAHRARGLCAMHWRREHGTRTTYQRTCDTCGETFQSSRSDGRFCDDDCKGLWYSEHGVRPPRSPRLPRLSRLPVDHPVNQICALSTKTCPLCDREFVARPGVRRTYCTRQCRWQAKAGRRSRRHLARRVEIFERDNYVCWICGGMTSPRYEAHDIWSPTVDHLVPQSLGGGDEPENLGTAHMWCNSIRGASMDISPAA